MSGVKSSPTASGQDSLLFLKFLAVKSVLELRQDESSSVQTTIGGTQKPKIRLVLWGLEAGQGRKCRRELGGGAEIVLLVTQLTWDPFPFPIPKTPVPRAQSSP